MQRGVARDSYWEEFPERRDAQQLLSLGEKGRFFLLARASATAPLPKVAGHMSLPLLPFLVLTCLGNKLLRNENVGIM